MLFVRVPTLGEEPHLTKISIIKMLLECCSLLLLVLLLLFLTSDLLFWSSFSPLLDLAKWSHFE